MTCSLLRLVWPLLFKLQYLVWVSYLRSGCFLDKWIWSLPLVDNLQFRLPFLFLSLNLFSSLWRHPISFCTPCSAAVFGSLCELLPESDILSLYVHLIFYVPNLKFLFVIEYYLYANSITNLKQHSITVHPLQCILIVVKFDTHIHDIGWRQNIS